MEILDDKRTLSILNGNSYNCWSFLKQVIGCCNFPAHESQFPWVKAHSKVGFLWTVLESLRWTNEWTNDFINVPVIIADRIFRLLIVAKLTVLPVKIWLLHDAFCWCFLSLAENKATPSWCTPNQSRDNQVTGSHFTRAHHWMDWKSEKWRHSRKNISICLRYIRSLYCCLYLFW